MEEAVTVVAPMGSAYDAALLTAIAHLQESRSLAVGAGHTQLSAALNVAFQSLCQASSCPINDGLNAVGSTTSWLLSEISAKDREIVLARMFVRILAEAELSANAGIGMSPQVGNA